MAPPAPAPAPAPALPPTMRAVIRPRRGPARTSIELAANIPTPAAPPASSSDVLIRVSHVALQYSTELLLRLVPALPFGGPWIPELELAGTVVAAGSGAPPDVREPGTAVVAFQGIPLPVLLGRGVLAEYVRLPGNQVARVGAGVDKVAAAGINGAGSTALKLLRVSGVKPGQTVLVNGASGSVGSLVVQLCRIKGIKVVGVASGANEEMVRGWGADEFIDYKKHAQLHAYLAEQYGDKPFDFILDCVGTQALFAHSPAYLKPEGALLNIGMFEGVLLTTRNVFFNTFLPTWLGGVPRRYIMFSTPPTREDALYIGHLVEEGSMRIPVDSVFSMEDVVLAYERVASQRARGKVVIKVGSE